MAIPALSHPPAEAPVQPERGSDEQRKHLLAHVLATKHQMGYEVESQTEFGAVIFTPSPRRWLRTRTGIDNERITINIGEDGTTRFDRSRFKPHDVRQLPDGASAMMPVDAPPDRWNLRKLAGRLRH